MGTESQREHPSGHTRRGSATAAYSRPANGGVISMSGLKRILRRLAVIAIEAAAGRYWRLFR